MIFSNNKGITLEQYKEPMFSKDIIRLEACDIAKQQSNHNRAVNPELLSPNEIVIASREARIIDEYDGRSLWKKISEAARNELSTIIIDAIDDEPYISSQISPAIRYSDKLADGIELLKRAVGVSKVKLEVYKNFFDIDTKLPSKIGGIKVDFVGGTYPVEQRAHKATRKKNSAVFGVCSIISLYDAIFEGYTHSTCFVTVAGDCIANPANYEVPIGYPVSEMLKDAGIVTEPKRLIIGGSMTGISIVDPDKIGISPTTRGILAFHDEFKKLEHACIGCGRCTGVCPQGLSPYYIYQVLKSKKRKNLELFDADKCIVCGLCSYVCPAKLDLQQSIAFAADLTRKMKEENK